MMVFQNQNELDNHSTIKHEVGASKDFEDIRENLYSLFDIEAEPNDDVNDNTKEDYKHNIVFDDLFKKSNDFWKEKSENLSDSEYEAWVMNYVSSEELASKPLKIDSIKTEKDEVFQSANTGMNIDFILKSEPDCINMTYRCVGCAQIFFEEEELARHNKRKHTSVHKEHVCNICERSYTQRGHLKEHRQRKHFGVAKPFKCDECEKSYSQKGHLNEHRRRHAGIKPYSCSECGKAYGQKGHLNEHKKSHRDIKPYACTECSLILIF